MKGITYIHTPDPPAWNEAQDFRVRYFRNGDEMDVCQAMGFTPAEVPLINHIGVSGGKDSGALLLWALHYSGYDTRSIVVSNCDTGNEDEVTYAQIGITRNRHPVHVIKPSKDFWELAKHKGLFPTRKKRFCTQFLKMEPTRYFVHDLHDAGFKVRLHSGVRRDESDARANVPEEDFDNYFGMPIRRPLATWNIAQVLDLHQKHGLPLNPLYALGATRVGCLPCINSVKAEMRAVSLHRPHIITRIEGQEAELTEQTGRTKTFFHAKTVPPRFRTRAFKTKAGKIINVCSINDVSTWSLTGKRARGQWDDNHELNLKVEQTCAGGYGACE